MTITKVEFRVQKDLAKMAEMIKEIDAETTEMKRKYRKLLEFVKNQARIEDDIYALENSDDYGDALTAMQMRDARKLLREIGEL